MGKILENDIPVYLVTFATQEILLFRNAKTGEVAVGAEDKVEQCTYVAAITRVEEELDNELTGGWKIIEVCACISSLSWTSHLFFSLCHRWADDLREHTFRRLFYFLDLPLHIYHRTNDAYITHICIQSHLSIAIDFCLSHHLSLYLGLFLGLHLDSTARIE